MKRNPFAAGLLLALGGGALLWTACTSLKPGECKRDSHCDSKGKEMQICYKEPPEAELGRCMTVREGKEALARYEKKKTGKCEDQDGDGAKAGDACDGPPESLDCNDKDPKVKPGSVELCDAIDNNCDALGLVNEGLKSCVGTVLGGKQDPVIQFMVTIPAGVRAGPNGQVVACDQHQIYRLDAGGKAERLAGSEKPGTENKKGKFARFDQPRGLAFDKDGSLFIADSGNNCVRKLSADGEASNYVGFCSSEADDTGKDAEGVGEAARFWNPIDVTLDKDGNLLVLDMNNSKVKRVGKDRKVVTVAGMGGKEVDGLVEFGHASGPALKAQFNQPGGFAVAPDGAVYVADNMNNCIRVWRGDQVSDLAGVCEPGSTKGGYADGAAAQAKFKQPQGVDVGPDGTVWVADTLNHCIRAIKDGKVSTPVGKCGQPGYYDGPAAEALFNGPMTVSVGKDGALWIVDQGNYRIRRFVP